MLKIMFYETIREFAAADYDTDIAQFEFVREIGQEPTADGIGMHTTYEMKVVKVFKGSLKPGDTITVQVFGGASDKVWIEDGFVERFTADFGYVLFLGKIDGSSPVMYQLASPMQGYVPLLDGKVSLNTSIENNGLFTQGETLEDLSARIEEAVK
jgi:3'-phosphoadenosine 5'-phosphosulfate sulfotransferase